MPSNVSPTHSRKKLVLEASEKYAIWHPPKAVTPTSRSSWLHDGTFPLWSWSASGFCAFKIRAGRSTVTNARQTMQDKLLGKCRAILMPGNLM